uniref:Protein kinase domain-containing protein n=1 Tax=Oryzias melastigma TaxID=30732 RepID=A0A3B3D9T3_ORYME
IKLDNIMMVNQDSAPYKIKLIDFGMAMDSWDMELGTALQIVPFRAPEVSLGLPLGVSADMWAIGMVLASLYFGRLPFTYDEEYDTLRCVVKWLGLPQETLLNKGLFSRDFFTFDKDCSQPGWRMNSPDEYSEITREAVRRLNNIPDLEEMKNIHKKMYDLFDDDDHRAFLNLLKNMLDLDPRQRITPSQALDHDFITMRHLSDSGHQGGKKNKQKMFF